ncbi:MAG: sensor histidine kinase [Bacteroidia bacterium]
MFRYAALLLFFYCLLSDANGQTTAYRNFTYKDGLPSSETYSVIQDSKGFIWVSTDRGIVKFDGIQFKTFTSKEGLPDNSVFQIFEDNESRIWFNTYSSRTGYLRNDTAHTYPYNSVIKSVLPFQLLNGLALEENDDLWFSKYDATGLFLLSRIDEYGILHTINPGVKRIYISRKGSCLLSGPESPGPREIILLETGEKIGSISFDEFVTNDVYATPVDGSGAFFLFAQGKAWHVSSKKSTLAFTFNGSLLCVYVDKQENIMLGFRNLGLRMYTSATNYMESRWLISNVSPSSVCKDREGGLWMTSLERGLFYFFPFLPVWYTEQDGLPTSKINGIKVIGDYRFLQLANGQLMVLKGRDSYSLKKHELIDSVLDIDYNPTYGLFLSGADRIKQVPRLKQTKLGFGKKISIGRSAVWVIALGNLFKYDPNGVRTDTLSFVKLSRPTCVYELPDDRLLVGTLDGLYVHDRKGIRFLGTEHTLLAQRISSIERIDSRHLILTTIGYGVIIIRESNGEVVHHYTTDHGLPSMMCNSACVEKNGVVWVATNRGICRIKRILEPASASFKTLDLNDGLVSNEVNEIQIIRDEIWLATHHGLSILPKQIADDREMTIPLYITSVSVNDLRIDPGSAGDLSPEQNTIRISFTGLHFWHPEKLTYYYRLRGADTTWYKGKDHFVMYNSLPHGDYVFEVGILKPDGSLSPGFATFSFRIRPEFYQTTWFYFLIACLFIGLVWIAFQFRVHFVMRQEQLKNELSQFRDRALRNQMNPHFVYNALNSIQNYILKKDTLHSASLLAKFSRLMRLTFNNTSQDRISLADDLSALELYVELEKIRFEKPFLFSIVMDPELNPEKVFVPPLLIQPFVENSIVHGISARTDGKINVIIKRVLNRLCIQINDNGVGRKESGRIGEKKRKYAGPVHLPDNSRPSSGVKTTATRINKLWPKNADHSEFKIIDLYDEENNPSGTKVEFYIPLHHD